MRIFWQLMVAAVLVGLGGCGRSEVVLDEVGEGVVVAQISLGEATMRAELVSNGQRQSGGGITYVYKPGTEGVLYAMPRKEISYFNAFGLERGVDFIWIADVGEGALSPGEVVSTESASLRTYRIVDIDREVEPEIEVDERDQTLYDSSVPVNFMLEVRDKWVSQKGVRVGDEVKIKIVDAGGSDE